MGRNSPRRPGAETGVSELSKWNLFPPEKISLAARKRIAERANVDIPAESALWDKIEKAIQQWSDYQDALGKHGANPATDKKKVAEALEAVSAVAKAVEALPLYVLYDQRDPDIQQRFIERCREMSQSLLRGEEVILEAKRGSNFSDSGSRPDLVSRRYLELISEVWPSISDKPLNLSKNDGGFIVFVVALSKVARPAPYLTVSKCKNLLETMNREKS